MQKSHTCNLSAYCLLTVSYCPSSNSPRVFLNSFTTMADHCMTLYRCGSLLSWVPHCSPCVWYYTHWFSVNIVHSCCKQASTASVALVFLVIPPYTAQCWWMQMCTVTTTIIWTWSIMFVMIHRVQGSCIMCCRDTLLPSLSTNPSVYLSYRYIYEHFMQYRYNGAFRLLFTELSSAQDK